MLETRGLTLGEELKLILPTINGKPAFLPAEILRDTSTSIQGTAGAIEKAGAILRGEQGRMKFLQVEPATGTYVAWNPLPDLTKFSFLTPEGVRIQSDGRIGMARVEVNPTEARVFVTHVWEKGQEQDETAGTALLLTGFQKAPRLDFNGVELTDVITRTVNGQHAYVLPLRHPIKSIAEMERSLRE